MSRCRRNLPRCLHDKFHLNTLHTSPSRLRVELPLPINRSSHTASTLLRNDVQTHSHLDTCHLSSRKGSLSKIGQPTVTKRGQCCIDHDTSHRNAPQTLQNGGSWDADIDHRFCTPFCYRIRSKTENTTTMRSGLLRIDRKDRLQNTFCNLLQTCNSLDGVFTCLWHSNRRMLSTLAAPETLVAPPQPKSRIGQLITPEDAFKSQHSDLDLNERRYLPLSISFEIFFQQLLLLQHRYRKIPHQGKIHFSRFTKIIRFRTLRGLTGSQLRDWIYNQPRHRIRQLLLHILLGSMVSSARKTLDVLAHIGPFRENFSNRMRCLRYIFWVHIKELDSNKDLMKHFDQQLAQLVESTDWPVAGMKRTQIRLILRRLEAENSEAFILRYLSFYVAPTSEALAEFARYYLEAGKVGLAFQMVSKMPDQSLQEPNKIIQEICVRILRHDAVIQSAVGPDFQYLPTLLEKGFQPDQYLHPLIIENALNGGYTSVAWDLYRYLSSTGNEIIARTYLLLLRHSFLHKDIQGVNEMMSIIHSREELYTNRFILAYAMNMVRVISFFERGCSADEALSHILALYDRAYNRSTLIQLGIVAQESSRESASKLWDPSPAMLGFTLWSYILCHRHPSHVHRLWNWIRYLADQGDDKILRTLEHDIIYNGLLLFYGRKSTTLLNALQVVQYMLEKKYCLPTSRTWSLLVCGYLKHDQLAQAHKIVDMMTQNGFTLMDLSESDMPAKYTVQDLASRKDEILDEKSMPPGLEVDQGDSNFSRLQWDATSSSRAKWKGMVDLRSMTKKE